MNTQNHDSKEFSDLQKLYSSYQVKISRKEKKRSLHIQIHVFTYKIRNVKKPLTLGVCVRVGILYFLKVGDEHVLLNNKRNKNILHPTILTNTHMICKVFKQ